MTQHTADQYGTPDKLQARIETHRRYTVGPGLEQAVEQVLNLTGEEALLDVGCGPGAFLAVTNASSYMQEWSVPFKAALNGIRGQHPDAQRFTERNGPTLMERSFGQVDMTVLDSALVFPQPSEALRYLVAKRMTPQGWRIEKQVVLLRARR